MLFGSITAFHGVFNNTEIATLVFLAPCLAFLGSFLVVVFHSTLLTGKYNLLLLVKISIPDYINGA